MTVKLSPIGNDAPFLDASGIPLNAGQLFTYLAGSVSTSQTTYTDSAGTVPNANPVVLNSNGYPASGGNVIEIWLTSGVAYKFVLKTSAGVTVWSRDNISGVNDATVTLDQWVSGPAPTYISATSFSLVGDQTSIFHVGRRLKTTNSGGTIYSTITGSAFGALTTITVVNDSGVLDSGLSAVSYGLESATNSAIPLLDDSYPLRSGSADATKKLRLEVDNLTTGTTRVWTAPNNDLNLATAPPNAILAGPSSGAAGNATMRALVGFDLPLRGYLSGLTMSTAGGSATMTIAAGQATDSTFAQGMTLASALAKTTSAWAVGNAQGGLDTGAIANSTWYHFWLIMRTDTGVVDVLISLSATAPTMPTNYTLKRRIGSGKTDGSAQWTAFIQDGDLFRWLARVADVAATNPGTAAVSRTLTVPTGVNVIAWVTLVHVLLTNTSQGFSLLSDLAANDEVPTKDLCDVAATIGGATSCNVAAPVQVRTNTSAQIRSRLSASDANTEIHINTYAWTDRRGRDS